MTHRKTCISHDDSGLQKIVVDAGCASDRNVFVIVTYTYTHTHTHLQLHTHTHRSVCRVLRMFVALEGML